MADDTWKGFHMPRRLMVLERQDRRTRVHYDRVVEVGDEITVGRSGMINIGIDPKDEKVSSNALTLVIEPGGARVDPTNRNGVELQYWGHSPRFISRPESVNGALVALRIVGGVQRHDRQYWVLMEEDGVARVPVETGPVTNTVFNLASSLTPPQMEAIRVVFADYLAWPPMSWPVAKQLRSAARRFGCTETAVRDRLDGARRRAISLGFALDVELTDPRYLYALIQAGLVTPETAGNLDAS